MFGKIEIFQFAVVLSSIIVVITDLVWGRIFNGFNLLVMVLGICFSAYYQSWSGIGQSLMGVLGGLVFFGWMFVLRIMGGGDVKFLMALGAWGGLYYTAEVAILAILVGGVMALGVLTLRGKIRSFLSRMQSFVLALLVKELEIVLPKVDKTLTMPFGVSIAIAAVWTAFFHPVQRWGVLPL